MRPPSDGRANRRTLDDTVQWWAKLQDEGTPRARHGAHDATMDSRQPARNRPLDADSTVRLSSQDGKLQFASTQTMETTQSRKPRHGGGQCISKHST